MAFYTNHSRYTAIVTIQVQSTGDSEKTLSKGAKESFENISADVGYHDFTVEPGQELRLGPNVSAVLIGTRSAE